MSEGARTKSGQLEPSNVDELCSGYVAELDTALKTARKNSRDTSLQRERLSLRFARKVKVGDS